MHTAFLAGLKRNKCGGMIESKLESIALVMSDQKDDALNDTFRAIQRTSV
jgi:hypothetical protein